MVGRVTLQCVRALKLLPHISTPQMMHIGDFGPCRLKETQSEPENVLKIWIWKLKIMSVDGKLKNEIWNLLLMFFNVTKAVFSCWSQQAFSDNVLQRYVT